MKNEYFFSNLKNDYPKDSEIDSTKDIFIFFSIKNGDKLTKLYLKSDVPLLADIFDKILKVSIKEIDFNPLYCVSLPGYTWQCELNYVDFDLQTF